MPSDPPQAELTQGWARIKTGLNLRDGASAEYAIVANLVPGEVVWVNSGPYREDADDQLDWYNVETLNDKYGWIASGSPDDPNATNISQQFTFRSCGPVRTSGSYGVVNGLRTPRLNEVELATFELAIAGGTHGCMRLSNEDYETEARVELIAHACGAPSWNGSVMSLAPTTAGNVDEAWRVDSTLTVPEALLAQGRTTDDGLTNNQNILILGSRASEPFGCVTGHVIRKDDSRANQTLTETSGCLVMTARGSAEVEYAAAGGGDSVNLLRSRRGQLAEVELGDPNVLRVAATSLARYPYATLGSQKLGDC